MNKKENIIIFVSLILAAAIFFGLTITGRIIANSKQYALKKVDEYSYEEQKKVEDTCRSYISSYKSDVDIYMIYRNDENEKRRDYAESARIRAIRTANQYNEFLTKNSFVWKENLPPDIPQKLDTDF